MVYAVKIQYEDIKCRWECLKVTFDGRGDQLLASGLTTGMG